MKHTPPVTFGPLFAPPVRADHPATSHAAADAIAPHADNLRERVFALIAAAEFGLTDEEIIARSGLSPSTARPRRIELVAAGRVTDSKRLRQTASGRKAIVWTAQRRST